MCHVVRSEMPPSLDPKHMLVRLDEVVVTGFAPFPSYAFNGVHPKLLRVKHSDGFDSWSGADGVECESWNMANATVIALRTG